MKQRKLISVLLATVMAAAMLGGCGSSSSGTSSSDSGSSEEAEEETASTEEDAAAEDDDEDLEWITVTVFHPKYSNEVDMADMAVFDVMSEKFHINFEFDNPSYDNYEERLNLVMMSTDLPDVIMDIPIDDVFSYGENGVILALNDYIENDMPNVKAEIDARDGVMEVLTQSDGNIYYLPMLDETPSGNSPYIVRADWLEALGLDSAPVTIEEWEEYWSLVTSTDLNGNGENDEIGFTSYDIASLRNFCVAWGVVDDFYTDPEDDGNVHYGPIEDGYKEALIWINEMWNAGYIDKEIITADYTTFSSKMSLNQVGSCMGVLGGVLSALNSTMPSSIEGFELVATEPPLGEAGVQIHTSIDQVPRDVVGATISATCENVDRVVEWLDYMYSEEGQILMNMGIEGEHYTINEDGEMIFTDYVLNNEDGLSAKEAVGTFTIAQGTMPSVLCYSETSQLDDESVLYAKDNCIIPFLDVSNEYIIPGTVTFSSEDNDQINSIMTDVETYVDEMVLKFITGDASIEDQWDTYVSNIENMGIQTAIDIYQEAVNG